MTLMLLLQAKILYVQVSSRIYASETTITTEEITAAVQDVIRNAEDYRNDIDAGEERIRQIRQYLDEMAILPVESGDTQIGSRDAVKTLPNFGTWVASFSGDNLAQEQEDDILLGEFKKMNMDKDRPLEHAPSVLPECPAQVGLIITDLLKTGSGVPAVEQLYVHSNTKIEEVLRVLRDRGISLSHC
jgi:hypothetical protein